jgi:LCP family protein required for cell wall assembly
MSPQLRRRRLLDPRGELASYEHSRRRARIIGRIVVGFFAVVVLAGAVGVTMVKNILDKVNHQPPLSSLIDESERPAPAAQAAGGAGSDSGSSGPAENILILGVDSRTGENSVFMEKDKSQTETLSDTTILAHLSADGKHVTLVSVPRDSVVQIPACEKVDADGNGVVDASGDKVMTTPRTALINEAIQLGGPACTVKTLEQLTDVRIDHYLEVDFTGVIKMSDALGGVPLTMCEPIHDANTGLNLPAGPVNLKGTTALAFVRARYGLTGGDDLHRIQRQQQFMASMARKALSSSNFFNILSMNKFYGDVASSLTTDMGSRQLIDLALRYRHIDTDQIVFGTVPVYAAPKGDKWYQHVYWSQDEAKALFTAIRDDRPLNTTTAGGQQVAELTVPPSQVSVRVLNATTRNNLAHDVANELAAKGFRIAGIASAATMADTTSISYAVSRTTSADTLASALGAPPEHKVVQTDSSTLTLTIGADWAGLATASPTASTAPSPSSAAGSPSAAATIPGLKATNAATDTCVQG